MDYRLSYTKDESPYDADEEFLNGVLLFDRESRIKILVQIEKSCNVFYRAHTDFIFDNEYDSDKYFFKVCGVVKSPDPMFYMVDYYSDGESAPVLLNIEEVDIDTYLDYVSKGEVLKELKE